MLGDQADEIAQRVFVEVYFSAKWADAPSCVYAWICRIAVNECYGFLRKKRLDRCYENDAATNDRTSDFVPFLNTLANTGTFTAPIWTGNLNFGVFRSHYLQSGINPDN